MLKSFSYIPPIITQEFIQESLSYFNRIIKIEDQEKLIDDVKIFLYMLFINY